MNNVLENFTNNHLSTTMRQLGITNTITKIYSTQNHIENAINRFAKYNSIIDSSKSLVN